ncbi:glycosyl transferase [Actinomyces sp. HMSC075C01]|uniref:Glycosyl transferase n=1 Tax=Actinomyces oris TaxID=544580 RepID=A0A1Q8W2N9_9ACTO|nr:MULTISPECIES: glycosyltransferase [Actinomyces]OFR51766.1 glycosyl transferase [Actinomyces sp. HMSC075C01]OLO55798.1 glycosyl transferase [Actinomyces oris]
MTPAGSTQGASRVGALAVVVSAGASPFLAQTLSAITSQTCAPDVVLVVDVASRANGLGDGTPIEELVERSGLDTVTAVRVVRAKEAKNFGDAVSRGLTAYAGLVAAGNRKRRSSEGADGAEGSDGEATSNGPRTSVRDLLLSGSGPITGPTGALSPITAYEQRLVAPTEAAPEMPEHQVWFWLLHDDSAPAEDCLERLLTAATNARSVGVVGPKQVGWDNPELLLEVGLRATASARRANDIVPGEVDQGQHDDRSDVLAVGTAGALVDRAVWEEIGGIAPWLGPFGDGLEFSRAARLAGYRVIVEPTAVIRHRRASYQGLRRPASVSHSSGAQPRTDAEAIEVALPEPDPERSFRARRSAQLTNWAAFSARPIGLLLTWFVILGLMRFVWRLASKAPALARDELGAALAVAGRGRRVRAARRRLAQHTKVPASALGRLYATAAEIRGVRRDRTRQERERRARAAAPSELELRELAALARSRRRTLSAVMVLVLVLSTYGLSRLLLTRSITGGALPLFSGDWRQMWDSAWSTWIATADGYPGGVTPLLAILALPAALGRLVGLETSALISALVLLALPLAALGAWFAAGTMTRKVVLRAWAALVWALSPSLLLALGQGRLGALLVHLVLPWALLALARAVGADRRDLVLSGLVGAHLLTDEERAELDRFSTEKVTDLAHLDEEAQAEAQADSRAEGTEDAADAVNAVNAEDDAEPAQNGEADSNPAPDDASDDEAHDRGEDEQETGRAARAQAAREAEVDLPPTEKYGYGSATAAAVAGLLLSVVVAAVPATAAVLAVIILLLSVTTRRGFKLVLTLVPMLVTAAPAWWGAWLLGRSAGWAEGVRLLLTDIGLPVSAPAPSSLDLLVGSPMDLDALVSSGALGALLRVLLALVPALGVIGLFVSRRVRVARTGILLAVGGLLLAGLCLRTPTGLGPDVDGSGLAPVNGWSGAGLSLALSGFLAAALTAGETIWALLGQRSRGDRRALERRSRKDADAASCPAGGPTARRRRSRRLTAAFTTAACLVLLAPVVVGGVWSYQAHRASNPRVLALHSTPQQIPLIAEQFQGSQAAGRVLRLTSTPQGLQATIWRGPGTQVSDVLPGAVNVEARTRAAAALVDPGLRPSKDGRRTRPTSASSGQALVLDDPADAELAQIVTRATAGQDKGAADALAAHGIAVVLLDDQEGDAVTAEARVGLASTPGLEQLAQTASGNSWRVTSSAHPDSARLSLLDSGGEVTPVASTGAGSGTRTRIPAGAGPRTLVMVERSDAGWSATLDGRRLEATTVRAQDGSWKQGFAVGSEGGELVVTHTRRSTAAATYTIWAVWALTLVAALPLRRGKETAS